MALSCLVQCCNVMSCLTFYYVILFCFCLVFSLLGVTLERPEWKGGLVLPSPACALRCLTYLPLSRMVLFCLSLCGSELFVVLFLSSIDDVLVFVYLTVSSFCRRVSYVALS
jgi:hypothetical protein